jgi:hypothetical protein
MRGAVFAATDFSATALDISISDLTVCAVIFRDKWCLDLNWELTERLCPGNQIKWVIVRNKPYWPEDSMDGTADRYHVVEGAEPDTDPAHKYTRNSYHHAIGMNIGTKHIKTRFVLFLDPDCFIIRPNWVQDVLRHMISNNLAFFGAPYNPKWYSKIRYFPVCLCLFVDTNRVDLSEFDWSPELGTEALPELQVDTLHEISHLSSIERLLIKCITRFDKGRIARRLLVGRFRDTGTRIYRKYSNRKDVHYECLVPVFKPQKYFSKKALLIERFLPDRYSHVPKRPGYFTTEGFAAHGLADYDAMDCEEYMWQNKPFALHVRARKSELRDPPAVTMEITKFLEVRGCPKT